MTQSIEKGFKKRAKPPSEAVLKKLKGECLKEVEKAKRLDMPVVFGKKAKLPMNAEKANMPATPELEGSIYHVEAS